MGVVLMRRAQKVALLAGMVAAATALAQQPPAPSQVKLPLKDYLALVERVIAVQHAQAEAAARHEPAVAAAVSKQARILWKEKTADVTTTFEVEVRGAPIRAVPLEITGALTRAAIAPPGSAALRCGAAGPEFIADSPGRYTVTASSVAELRTDAQGAHLDLAADTTPVAATTVDLPAELAWKCPGAVVASDEVDGDRRSLRLALAHGSTSTFHAWRQAKGEEQERALARAVTVTIVQLTPDGARRHDAVLYEVSRGALATLTVDLPAGLVVERLASDEGELPAEIDGHRVVVQRTQRLTGVGHLVLSSAFVRGASVPLEPVVPDVEVRARYLAWAPGVAAEATPEPKDAWTRVDIADLPDAIRSAADGIRLSAAWLAAGVLVRPSLTLAVLPTAPERQSVVRRRATTTLLTKDGTVLHRDVFTVARAGSALELRMPGDATLWSASVNGLAVRPLPRDGSTLVPLPLGAQEGATVDVVVVQERAVPSGRSRVSLAPPEVVAPVLEHDWRLLLPEAGSYRYVSGTLRPAPEPAQPLAFGGAPPVARAAPRPTIAVSEAGSTSAGTGALSGKVTDGSDALPGVTVTARSASLQGMRTTVTDASGAYTFRFLPGGAYTVRFELAGFQTVEQSTRVPVTGTQFLDSTMPQAKVAEEIVVSGVAPTIDVRSAAVGSAIQTEPPGSRAYRNEAALSAARREKVDTENFRDQVANLKQGLVGGVRPVPVTIPESGKSLLLAGALPPASVTVELDVKQKR